MNSLFDKVLVIGWDGATWDIINPLLKRNKMPTLKKIIKSSFSSTLLSTIPPMSAPAWVSFMTGVKPEKHGIVNFFVFDKRSRRVHFKNALDIPYPTLWEHLSFFDVFSIVINVPLTFPPRPFKGLLITDLLTTPRWPTTYPPNIHFPQLIELGRNIKELYGYWTCKDKHYINALEDIAWRIADVSMKLLKSFKWRLSAIVFLESDRIQHYFYHDTMAIEKIYSVYDDILSRFLGILGEDDCLLIISDHGFGEIKKVFFTNQLLYDLGLLKFKMRPEKLLPPLLILSAIYKIAPKVVLRKFLQSFLRKTRGSILKHIIEIPRDVDFNMTKALALGRGEVYVLESDPHIRVSLIKYIQRALASLKDDNTKVIEDIHILSIEKHQMPDIIFEPNEGYATCTSHLSITGKMISSPLGDFSGVHRRRGIFLAFNPNRIRAMRRCDIRLNIVDIFPTICSMLKKPIPLFIDGTPQIRLFKSTITPKYMSVRGSLMELIRIKQKLFHFYKNSA